MALPFLSMGRKRRDKIVAIDLGFRITKAIYLERSNDRFRLVNYVTVDAPVSETAPTLGLLAEHLKKVSQSLGARTKQVILAIGVGDSLIRHTEMPMAPVSDMRSMLKLNPKTYLQQDLSGHVFDCHIMPPRPGAVATDPGKGTPKCRVIVGGAKQQLIDLLQGAAKASGLVVDRIVPGLVGPVNAFEFAQSEVFHKEVIGLVDLGFKHSTISILELGDLMLSRVVAIGGDRLTSGLAEAMNISYAEAEGIKIGMPQEVASNLQPLIAPLGRELRVSIDFFEHQQDKTVSQVYVSGASARSDFILEAVQSELMIPCKGWNPAGFLEPALVPSKMGELEQVSPLLSVVVGAAVTVF
jgi:Tfp pilus assembly PilM family ATPase